MFCHHVLLIHFMTYVRRVRNQIVLCCYVRGAVREGSIIKTNLIETNLCSATECKRINLAQSIGHDSSDATVLYMHVCLQTKVSRLGSPYCECFDPSSRNSTRNAYEELYPIEYSETVNCTLFIFL